MKVDQNAKLADIHIVEVPHQWRGMVPEREIGLPGNCTQIKMKHGPSGTTFTVNVDSGVEGAEQIAEARAKAKLEFIGKLHERDI